MKREIRLAACLFIVICSRLCADSYQDSLAIAEFDVAKSLKTWEFESLAEEQHGLGAAYGQHGDNGMVIIQAWNHENGDSAVPILVSKFLGSFSKAEGYKKQKDIVKNIDESVTKRYIEGRFEGDVKRKKKVKFYILSLESSTKGAVVLLSCNNDGKSFSGEVVKEILQSLRFVEDGKAEQE